MIRFVRDAIDTLKHKRRQNIHMTFFTSTLKRWGYMCFDAAISLIIKDNTRKFSEYIQKSQNLLSINYFYF